MQKSDLISLGLTAEQANSVLNLYKSSLNDNFIPKYRFDEINSELKEIKQQVKDRDNQIKGLGSLQINNEELQAKLKELQSANAEQQTKYNEQLNQMKKANAVKLSLMNSGDKPYDLQMVMDLINLDKVQLNASGEIIDGFNNQIAQIKAEKNFLFQNSAAKTGNSISGVEPNNAGAGGANEDELVNFGKKLAEQTNALYKQSFGNIPAGGNDGGNFKI